MSTRYFQKELPESPVYIKGSPIKFDLLSTEDPALIAHLDQCIREQRGGIISLTKEQYDSLVQKKSQQTSSASSSKQNQRGGVLSALRSPVAGGGRIVNGIPTLPAGPQIEPTGNQSVASGRDRPDPIQVPSPNQFKGLASNPPPPPPTGKITPP